MEVESTCQQIGTVVVLKTNFSKKKIILQHAAGSRAGKIKYMIKYICPWRKCSKARPRLPTGQFFPENTAKQGKSGSF
jgi:hypothetical protein